MSENTGSPGQKKLVPKTCCIWHDFIQLQTLMANIPERVKISKRHMTESDCCRVLGKKSGELWYTNYQRNWILQFLLKNFSIVTLKFGLKYVDVAGSH